MGMQRARFCSVLQRLQRKDMRALQELYEEYFQKVWLRAQLRLKDRQAGYDVAMTVMLRLCSYKGDASLIRNPDGFVAVMTENAVKDVFRKNSRSIADDAVLERVPVQPQTGLWADDVFALLDEREREVLVEHAVWGKKLKQVAAELGVSYATVKRVYLSVKRKLTEYYDS